MSVNDGNSNENQMRRELFASRSEELLAKLYEIDGDDPQRSELEEQLENLQRRAHIDVAEPDC